MNWLRRQQDIASLFAVWALLFQVLLGPFAMAGHAFGATSLGGIICTTRGLVGGAGTTLPKQSRQHDDCVGCGHACRTVCGMTPIAVSAADEIRPGSFRASYLAERELAVNVEAQFEFCSRGPPTSG